MNKIFMDTDIILDLLTQRKPHYLFAAKLFDLIEKNKIIAYTSPLILANIYYISAKLTNREKALDNIRKLTGFLKTIPIDEQIIMLALNSNFKDFEDSIQYYTAKKQNISIIVTRNKSDYKVKDMTICTAEELIIMLSSQSKN
jgi:predicted nucleic acid-binding protein